MILIPVLLVSGLPCLLFAFHAFDALLLIERDHHAAHWQADGCPRPLLFPARRAWPRSIRSLLAARWLSLLWLFRAPHWLANEPEGQVYLRRLRIAASLWNLVIVPLMLASLIVAVRAR